MQNDMLKNAIAPWQEKGRWYHGVVNVATLTYDTDKTDDFLIQHAAIISTSNNTIIPHFDLPNIRVIDSKHIPDKDFRPSANGYAVEGSYYLSADGRQFPGIGPSGNAGKIEFWVFIIEL